MLLENSKTQTSLQTHAHIAYIGMNAFLIKAFICRLARREERVVLLRITIKLLQQRWWLCTVANSKGLLTLTKEGVDSIFPCSFSWWVLLGANVHSFGTNALQSSRIANSSRRCSFPRAFAPVFWSHHHSLLSQAAAAKVPVDIPEKLAPKMEVYELQGLWDDDDEKLPDGP